MIRPVRTSPLTLQIKFCAMLFRQAVVWYHRPMTDHKHKMSDFAGFDTDALLSWYDQHARHLPWRAFSPERAPAYHVFLSELMLQQTVVATVIPYFQAFLRRWPDIQALAAADEDEILKAWAGLGYYARARNMLKAARAVCEEHNGRFPERADQLIKLPGIGPYTAGAIAAIAFDQPAVVLDGNIERVLIRFAAIDRPKKQVKDRLAQGYSSVLPRMRLSDFPQAVMDLGATVCTPNRPDVTYVLLPRAVLAAIFRTGCLASETGKISKAGASGQSASDHQSGSTGGDDAAPSLRPFGRDAGLSLLRLGQNRYRPDPCCCSCRQTAS